MGERNQHKLNALHLMFSACRKHSPYGSIFPVANGRRLPQGNGPLREFGQVKAAALLPNIVLFRKRRYNSRYDCPRQDHQVPPFSSRHPEALPVSVLRCPVNIVAGCGEVNL
jgi:hypothetical protein